MKLFVVFSQDTENLAVIEGVYHKECDAQFYADWIQAKLEDDCYKLLGSLEFKKRIDKITQYTFVVEKGVQ